VLGVGIGVRIYSRCAYAILCCGSADSQGDFTAICYEDGGEGFAL